MRRKMITHGLVITAIMIMVFIAAALTPASSYNNSKATTPINLAKVDFGGKMIADNEIPMAQTPSEKDNKSTLWIVVIAAAAVMSSVVIFEEIKDKRSEKFS